MLKKTLIVTLLLSLMLYLFISYRYNPIVVVNRIMGTEFSYTHTNILTYNDNIKVMGGFVKGLFSPAKEDYFYNLQECKNNQIKVESVSLPSSILKNHDGGDIECFMIKNRTDRSEDILIFYSNTDAYYVAYYAFIN